MPYRAVKLNRLYSMECFNECITKAVKGEAIQVRDNGRTGKMEV